MEPGDLARTANVRGPVGLGAAYTGGGQTPPCGVTYLQSSSDLPNRVYSLAASFTWTVTWTGSDDTVNIPVGEVQSVNAH